jgi:hypothetical protein
MTKKKGYVSVVDMVDEVEDYGLRFLFLALEPEERPEKLAEFFLLAAGKGKDEAALKFYKLLLQAFKDIEAIPLLMEKKGVIDLVLLRDEMLSFHQRVSAACTLKTMELFEKISGFMKNVAGNYIENPDWIAPKEAGKLLESKKAMLGQVMTHWKNSESNREADECFLFLIAAFEYASPYKEADLFESMLRDATPKNFPIKRLVRHYQMLFPSGSITYKKQKIGEVLLKAWARNIDPEDAFILFQALEPLMAIKRDFFRHQDKLCLFELLGRQGADDVLIYAAAMELVEQIKLVKSSYSFGDRDIKIFYPNSDCIKVSVEVDLGNCTPVFHFGKRRLEDVGNEWFELIRNSVIKWREQYIHYKVSLALSIKQGHGSKLLFFRDQPFGE